MPNTTTRKCKYCSKSFEAEVREINRGNAKFCSLSCASKYSHKNRSKDCNVKCAYCQKPIHRTKSQIKASKTNTFFCCREHKDKGQSLESGITKVQPDHYGKGETNYRKRKLREIKEPKCSECERKLPLPVLHVHHIDRDRSNNKLDNLEVLCPTCHELKHFYENTGKWGQ
jgi:5-methylcytosine-specific restriction endonuclease McrA